MGFDFCKINANVFFFHMKFPGLLSQQHSADVVKRHPVRGGVQI